MATTEDMVIPAIPGTAIACGMRLITTGMTLAQFESKRHLILAKLKHVLLEDGRNVPLRSKAFAALFDVGPEAFIDSLVLAELVRDSFAQVFSHDKSRLVVDVPHNVILREHGMNIHRKGATPAREGDLALIPGSMGDYSYLATGMGNPDWLWSCSHGAGRSIRRQAMRAVRPAPGGPEMEFQCVTLREERRVEEAPMAYKKIGPVISAQEEAGLLRLVARLKPLLTFKA